MPQKNKIKPELEEMTAAELLPNKSHATANVSLLAKIPAAVVRSKWLQQWVINYILILSTQLKSR